MRYAGRALGLLVGLIGIGVMWFATQVADEGDVVVGKIEVAHWLETSVWVDAILILVGLSIVFTASVLMVLITRRTVWDFLMATSLVLITGIGCVLVWATAQGHCVNLTRSWPQ